MEKNERTGERKTSEENIERENLIKNDLRIRTEVLNDFVFRTRRQILPILYFLLVQRPNKGNHHAGKRDTRVYRRHARITYM